MGHVLFGLLILSMLLFFWSNTYWAILGWFAGLFVWVSCVAFALTLIFNDMSGVAFAWGVIIGVPLYIIGYILGFFNWFCLSSDSHDEREIYNRRRY